MKIVKNSRLFIVLLVLGIAFYLPVAFVKAEDSKQKEINDNQINVKVSEKQDNNKQEDVNDNQGDNQDDQEEVNDNQDNNKPEDVNDDQGDNEDDQFDVEEHMSTVSSFVQNLLKVADKEHGQVGEQIKAIAKEQDDNKDNVVNEIDKIQHRNKVKTFLIGTDYENIGQLRSEMVKTSNQIDQLNKLLDQTTNADNKAAIQAQIKVLEQEQQKIGDLLQTNESKFSLFGWFVKLFY